MKMLMTCAAVAAFAIGGATIALAQGGGYDWNGSRETRAGVEASHSGGDIRAVHPNAFALFRPTNKVIEARTWSGGPQYSGHGNAYYLSRDESLTKQSVEIAGESDPTEAK